MEIKAESHNVRISPRKVRLIADAIREHSVQEALRILSVLYKRAGGALQKTLKSAIANAVNNKKLKEENLRIKSIEIGGGMALKRYHPSTRGRMHPYKKRASHIKVILEEVHGTKN
ncbi:MAG: 50S ribosomal protein L22 [Candidatus Levybacteria bacterium]|nr:50S ribosomal protein L22 [Candidatus Levybacteria bacterium]